MPQSSEMKSKVKSWEVSDQFWEGVMPLIPRPQRVSLSYFHLKGGEDLLPLAKRI